jgi:hypothetical protein
MLANQVDREDCKLKLSRVVVASIAIAVFAPAHVTVKAAPQPGTVCLQDDSLERFLTWDDTSGAYTFQTCGTGSMTLTGTGKVGLVNGIKTLTDSKPDRRISAGFLTAQLTGSATVYLMVAPGVWQTFRIKDTNIHPSCECPVIAGGGRVPLIVFLFLVAAWRIVQVRRSARRVAAG